MLKNSWYNLQINTKQIHKNYQDAKFSTNQKTSEHPEQADLSPSCKTTLLTLSQRSLQHNHLTNCKGPPAKKVSLQPEAPEQCNQWQPLLTDKEWFLNSGYFKLSFWTETHVILRHTQKKAHAEVMPWIYIFPYCIDSRYRQHVAILTDKSKANASLLQNWEKRLAKIKKGKRQLFCRTQYKNLHRG